MKTATTPTTKWAIWKTTSIWQAEIVEFDLETILIRAIPERDLFPTREAVVTEWISRLETMADKIAKELAKWSEAPTDTEILAWIEQNVTVNWPYLCQMVFMLNIHVKTALNQSMGLRKVVIHCIREEQALQKTTSTTPN